MGPGLTVSSCVQERAWPVVLHEPMLYSRPSYPLRPPPADLVRLASGAEVCEIDGKVKIIKPSAIQYLGNCFVLDQTFQCVAGVLVNGLYSHINPMRYGLEIFEPDFLFVTDLS